jgi:transposase InsO family protein
MGLSPEGHITRLGIAALLFLLLGVVCFALRKRVLPVKAIAPTYNVRKPGNDTPQTTRPRTAPKPPWVIEEVLRLRALSGRGCLKVAQMFNRRHAGDGMSVGKSFVAKTIKTQAYRLLRMEREIHNSKPRKMPKNTIWGIDLTEVRLDGQGMPVFGIIDHGTRACLTVQRIVDLSTIGILEVLFAAIKKFGKPKIIKSDNGSVFTSRLFGFVLMCLGIHHKRAEPFMPWQNGRIERFFGTFKEAIRQVTLPIAALPMALDEFRFFYNHVRPHTNIDGRTPAEAWSKIRKPQTEPVWFEAWDGVLCGDYYPP